MTDKYSNIPESLKKLNQWVCYKLVYNEKRSKHDKIPKNPHNGYNAKSNDRATWSDYETAVKAVKLYNFDGIGIELEDEIFCVDLDNVIDENGNLTEEAKDIVKTLDSYTEYSPSKKGLHIICKGKISCTGKRKRNIEMYSSKRFFTVTGDILGSNKDIEQRSQRAEIIYNKYLKEDKQELSFVKLELSDNEIIDKASSAKNGDLFKKLWNGNAQGYNSPSEADQALCNILAFYCGDNFKRIDNLFCKSGLYREKWDRLDYKSKTINKAISDCKNTFSGYEKSDKKPIPKNKKTLTIFGEEFKILNEKALSYYLKSINVNVRYNVIKRAVEIKGVKSDYNPETLQNDLPVILFDNLKGKLKKCDKSSICDLLSVIAGKNRFNPVIEMIGNAKWDGKDRIQELFSILNIGETDELSKTLIKKWLWQALSMAKNEFNGAYGADGILVLQGKQGIGKTTFVRKIAVHQELCKLGQYLDTKDKDTYRRCCSAWIVELGEIETTFKSDLERLKAFITAEIDEYRLPYGRSDQTLARRTAIIGTCNSEKFLIDPTGSRRFWTVPITSIDLDRLSNFDVLQLWLQVEEKTKNNRQGFRLTKDEQLKLAERNTVHEKPLKGQSEVIDVLSKTNKNLVYRDVTVSDFKENHSELKRYSVEQISTVLNKLDIKSKIVPVLINGKRTTKRVRNLPIWGCNYE